MRTVAQSEAIATLPKLLDEVEQQPVVISREGKRVAALVSMKSFELMRKANVKSFLDLCDQTSEEIATAADAQGVPLDEVQRYLLSDDE
jgi:prevent-host-death family protein